MNYSELETLREDVAALGNGMCDLRTELNRMEAQYRYDAASLAERMASQTLRRINALFLEAYREVLALDETFQD
ncbi:hypothetical protein MUA04_03160 [Enterobacteriaceae bacterium H11S18]|uniref:hypothetical protein n=1 Tax=Dryocola clanedunensis TaxID=2925396 RepID=UPI0022F0040E|nr:hypothetical protein [Dryocola clanedunensis]MCT4709195.1 hypothetical protein [Dryocola clanedunensis]